MGKQGSPGTASMDPNDIWKLQKAVVDRRYSDVVTFLNSGCDVNSKDKDGNTSLHIATKNGDLKMMEILCASNCKLDTRDTWASWSPLHHAVWLGNRPAVQLLIGCGCDTDARDKEGQTPLHLAAMRGRLVEALLLLDAGAFHDLRDQKLFTPLHCAVSFGSLEVVQALLQKGADRTLRNKEGKTPEQLAEGPKRHTLVSLFQHRAVSTARQSHSTAPGSPKDIATSTEAIRLAELSVARAREEVAILRSADRMRRLEDALQQALSEKEIMRRLLDDRERRLKSVTEKEAAAHAKAVDEETKRKESDTKRRILERQMTDAMQAVREAEEQRLEMEKQLKLEVTVRELTEARALEEEVKRANAESRLSAEVKAKKELEVKLKEQQDRYKQLSTQLGEMEKARLEDHNKLIQMEKQTRHMEEQVADAKKQKLGTDDLVKMERDLRMKADEKVRKAEAFAKEEQRLRKEEEKMRKETQSRLAEESKARALAEAKALEESKKRARAEIKAMAEENRRVELEEKAASSAQKVESLSTELSRLRADSSGSSSTAETQQTAPVPAPPSTSGPATVAVEGALALPQDAAASDQLAPSDDSGERGIGRHNAIDACLKSFGRLLQSSREGSGDVCEEDVAAFVDGLRQTCPSADGLWRRAFAAYLGNREQEGDVEELRNELDALKATLKQMAEKGPDAGSGANPTVQPSGEVKASTEVVGRVEKLEAKASTELVGRIEKLEADLKDALRKKEEAETRCHALEQVVSSQGMPQGTPLGMPQVLAKAPQKPEASPKGVVSVFEKFQFRAKVVPESK